MLGMLKRRRKVDKDALEEAKEKPCVSCGRGPTDPAHIKSRGSGGDDSWENVIPLCRSCHRLQHAVGICRFVRTHEAVRDALHARGWEVVREFDRWLLRRI